ncbi:MAG: MFS transporter [Wenzhouxiangellaceae bacterium]|nr:MFS transporter [Wenzhouxiangellaceae bacterium]
MRAIFSICTLLLGVAIILAGNGLLSTLLGVRGQFEQLSTSALGIVMAGYFGGFIIGTFQVPRLIRRVGHIRTFAALASIASVATLLHGLYVHAASWFLLRVISGVCIVGLYIVIESWLNEQTDNEHRGSVFSAYMTTTLIGLGAGQLLLMVGDATRLELFALASVLLSLGLVPVAMTDVHEPTPLEAHRLGLRKLYAISPLGVIACVFAGLGAGSFWGLGPVFAAAIGLDKAGIAAFMSLTILGGIAMLWPVGRLSDRYPRRTVLAWACAFASAGASLTALLMPYGNHWVMAGGFAYGAFAFSMYSLAAAHTNDHLDREHVLEVTSTLQLLWASGAIAGPVVAGVLMQRIGPETLMLFIAATAVAPAIFARYRMAVSEAIPVEDQGTFVPQFATSPAALEMYPEEQPEAESPPNGA